MTLRRLRSGCRRFAFWGCVNAGTLALPMLAHAYVVAGCRDVQLSQRATEANPCSDT